VTWSYDVLDDPERSLLERCSVFAGGFGVESACAVAGSDDEFNVLDLLDALVRKSLLVADPSTGRTRFSMLETIRQFAEEKLVARWEAAEASAAHAHHFADREAEIMALWDSPRQRDAYDWFGTELPNLVTSFRWAAHQCIRDFASTIATYAGLLGFGVENYEPVAWAEELVNSPRTVGNSRLANLCVIASLSWTAGRIGDAGRYLDMAETELTRTRYSPPYGTEGWLGAVYLPLGQPERWAELFRTQLERRGDSHVYIRACRVFGLAFAGSAGEASAAAEGLIDAGVVSDNPYMHSFALAACSFPLVTTDPARGLDICRQGFELAQDSGNRFNESILALNLARLEALQSVTAAAFDHLRVAIRNYHDSGNVGSVRSPLAVLSDFLARVGRLQPAAIIAGFSLSPLAVAAVPELITTIAHLRDALGDQIYESSARRGEAMTIAAIAAYAYDQIDQTRSELEQLR
jgi:hypothetical protein